jgi:hypothetical protein
MDGEVVFLKFPKVSVRMLFVFKYLNMPVKPFEPGIFSVGRFLIYLID